MNSNLKKALIIFGGGIVLFWAFRKMRPYGGSGSKYRSGQRSKVFSDEQRKNAAIVVKAYSDAVKANENKAFLDEMNAEFAKSYNMRVVPNKGNGSFIATDLEGNKIV